MKRYDVLVVGGGPAGSTTALRLAEAGASVLLVDKAVFPRNKPCGGGLTLRAIAHCPVDVSPVVEAEVSEFAIAFRYGKPVHRKLGQPVVLMTQRVELDAFLLDAARERGVEVREGTTIDVRDAPADVVVGADGANGTTARALGIGHEIYNGVAYEGNVRYRNLPREISTACASIEIGTIPGGYGWVFPKGDHANVGVGAWATEGPRLKQHLQDVCAARGIPFAAVEALRGHRLPLRRQTTTVANERGLLVGDAAGLIDPVSGDGMYECFVSAQLAARAILGGTIDSYPAALEAELGRLHRQSWAIKRALDRWPRASWRLARSRFAWKRVEPLLLGDSPALTLRR